MYYISEGHYKLGEYICYKNIKNEGYYLEKKNGNSVWKKCYQNCNTCDGEGTSDNMNCKTCSFYYYYVNPFWRIKAKYRLTDEKNCVKCQNDNYYYDNNYNCVDKCPPGSYGYSLEHSCLTVCPTNYVKDDTQQKCVIETFEETIQLDEFQSQVTENITNYLNYTLINGSDFIAAILSNDKEEPEKQLEKGISAVNLGQCSPDIKDYYHISRNESLIILNMESKIDNIKTKEIEEEEEEEMEGEDNSYNNLRKITQVEVFDISGRNLNLSVCDKEITIMKFINDTLDEETIEFAENMAKQGINVFNLSDDFFNDFLMIYVANLILQTEKI